MMKRISLVLLVISFLGCATKSNGKVTTVLSSPDDPVRPKVLPPIPSAEETAVFVRTSPTLECLVTRTHVSLKLKGRLGLFKYGQSGLEKGFNVCLIGEINEWRPTSEYCRSYVPDPNHEYLLGPFLLPKKDRDRFTFANVVQNLEYRWGGIKFITVSGACRLEPDDGGDRFVFTKHK